MAVAIGVGLGALALLALLPSPAQAFDSRSSFPVETFKSDNGTVVATIGQDGTYTGSFQGNTNSGILERILYFGVTNYTAKGLHELYEGSGTNQFFTLPNGTNGFPTGRSLTIVAASTTGSLIVTNANSAQKIRGGLAVSITSTNRMTLTWDGTGWW